MISILFAIALAAPAERDMQMRYRYIKANPCPYTREVGCILDHRVALCKGGADHPDNLQWLTRAEARVKDRADKAACAAARRQRAAK